MAETTFDKIRKIIRKAEKETCSQARVPVELLMDILCEANTGKPRWIPVSEKPMAWFNKLVSFKYKGETYFGEGHWTGAKWVVTGFPNNKFPNEIEVTHWMQPPELPKDGE